MSKKRVSPRAPFVVTVAMAGSSLLGLLPACNSDITTITNPPLPEACPADPPQAGSGCDVQMTCDYNDADLCGSSFTCTPQSVWEKNTPPGTCNPPAPACPEVAPAPQSACDPAGQTCQYADNCGGLTTAYCGTLEGGDPTWQVSFDGPPCNPPACPELLPPPGSPCDLNDQICEYQVDFGCGPEPTKVTCVNGAWAQTNPGPTCNPPPPEPCAQYADPAACQADAMCDWLTPGCSEPQLPVAGCHSKTPCATDADCMPGNSCQELVIDPCWMQACNACGAGVMVCWPKSTL